MAKNPLRYVDLTGHWPGENNQPYQPKQATSLLNTLTSLPPSSNWHKPLSNMTSSNTYSIPGHPGEDYPRATGTQIKASGSGVVVINDACSAVNCIDQALQTGVEFNGGYGNVLVIEYPYDSVPPSIRDSFGVNSGESIYMLYAHLQERPDFDLLDTVYGGQYIGLIGSTGNSTGSHLHLEVRVGDTGSLYGPMCTDTSCAGNFSNWYDNSVYHPIDPDSMKYLQNQNRSIWE